MERRQRGKKRKCLSNEVGEILEGWSRRVGDKSNEDKPKLYQGTGPPEQLTVKRSPSQKGRLR